MEKFYVVRLSGRHRALVRLSAENTKGALAFLEMHKMITEWFEETNA